MRPDLMPDPDAVRTFEAWRRTYPANRRFGGVPYGPFSRTQGRRR